MSETEETSADDIHLSELVNDLLPGYETEMFDLAKQALEAQKNDRRTLEEKIADGVAFILDTRIGGW